MSLAVLASETAVKPSASRADRKADASEEPGKFKNLLKNDAEGSDHETQGEVVAVKTGAADGKTLWSRYHELVNRTATGIEAKIAGPGDGEETEAQDNSEAALRGEEVSADEAGTVSAFHNKVPEIAAQSTTVRPAEKTEAVPAKHATETEMRAEPRVIAKAEPNGDVPQPANRTANAAATTASSSEVRHQPVAPQRGENTQQNQSVQQATPVAGTVGRDGETGDGANTGERDGNGQGGGRDQSPAQAAQPQSSGRVSGVTVLSQQTAPAPVQPMTQTASALTEALAEGLTRSQRAAASEVVSLQPQSTAKAGMVTTLNIQLQPIDLGTVTARISGTEGQLSIDITVENAEARQRLTTDSDSIVTALRSIGIEVDRVTVQQTQTTAGTQQNNTGRDQQFGQSQDGQSEGRGGNSGRGYEQEGGHGARTQGNETSDPAGSGLYI
ncbi:MAG: flagellar hook-length control protein FliK [Rhizobiaceae bacterium]|nr:flagellar hook-length control protein FliK [Rhizobiaceae bacterium]